MIPLKYLVGYLPYRLRLFHSAFMFKDKNNESEIGTMVGITDVVQLDVLGETTFDIVMRRDKDFYKLHDSRGHFKPILRPLSDLFNGQYEDILDEFSEQSLEAFKMAFLSDLRPLDAFDKINYTIATKLFKNHFDLFRLIEDGLAVDINTLK